MPLSRCSKFQREQKHLPLHLPTNQTSMRSRYWMRVSLLIWIIASPWGVPEPVRHEYAGDHRSDKSAESTSLPYWWSTLRLYRFSPVVQRRGEDEQQTPRLCDFGRWHFQSCFGVRARARLLSSWKVGLRGGKREIWTVNMCFSSGAVNLESHLVAVYRVGVKLSSLTLPCSKEVLMVHSCVWEK